MSIGYDTHNTKNPDSREPLSVGATIGSDT